MSDRFRFRCWDKDRKCFLRDDEFVICPDGEDSYFNADYDLGDFIIEQCTGLKDKNGKLIYEGDIVKCRYYDNFDGTERESVGRVYWHKEDCAFYIFISLEEEIGFYGNSIEVIGNIHENPELLQEKHNEVSWLVFLWNYISGLL